MGLWRLVLYATGLKRFQAVHEKLLQHPTLLQTRTSAQWLNMIRIDDEPRQLGGSDDDPQSNSDEDKRKQDCGCLLA